MELFETNEKLGREEFAPLSFWAWNDKMDDESIRKRILEFHQQGFHGFFMHSRGGLLTPYLSDEWFHACKTAAKEAKKYGMEAWIYDEDGWPSGFAGGRVNGLGEEYLSKYFHFQTVMPDDREHVIGSYKKEGSGYHLCDFEEADLWVLYESEPNYVDLLSKKVTRAFLTITYERYKQELGEYFGKTVPGFFTDEPQFFHTGYPYSFELSAYFKKRNGYAMEEELYRLLPECAKEDSFTFRRDYWNTIQEMMQQNFSRQIYDWCQENGVIFTGHYPGEDSLIQQIGSTAGVMPKYQYMQMPGIDHLGRRITSLLLTKQVTSAAKQLGRKKILSETFGCGGWNIPFEELCYIWGWQASAGINVPALHIGAHTMAGIRKRDYPAFYSYQEPWWNQFHHISDWLGGIGLEMAKGRWMEEVLVISPMQSIFCAHGSDTNLTDKEREIAASYRQLCDCLMNVQIGFDLGDETILTDSGQVKDGMMQVGNCGYRYVIVSKSIMIGEPVWELLEQLHQQGGTVIFTDQIPKGEKNRKWTVDCAVVCNTQRFWLKYFQSIHFNRIVTIYEQGGFYLASGLSAAVKTEGDVVRAYIWNQQGDCDRELMLKVQGNRSIWQVHPETLKKKQLSGTFQDGDGNTLLPIRISKKQSILLEMKPGEGEYPEEEMTESRIQIGGNFSRMEDNALVIDYASYSLDGIDYLEELPIVKLHPQLYKELAEKPSEKIHIRYKFDNQMTSWDELKVVVEDRDCIDILCNQISIFSKKSGWYMDREFSVYRIGKNVKKGRNTLEVIYRIEKPKVVDTEGLFETEVNRFFYPVEPEAVYLLGDFSVGTTGKINRHPTHIKVKGLEEKPEFYLCDAEKLQKIQDVTPEGLWFYRGNLQMDITVMQEEGKQVFLKVRNPKAALLEARCADKTLVSYMNPYVIELSEILQPGENLVQLILYGTNRNLLGPHHHIKGENLFVGCNTFKGQKGYEDTMFNYELESEDTWTDDYSFVAFGCDKIELITKEYLQRNV